MRQRTRLIERIRSRQHDYQQRIAGIPVVDVSLNVSTVASEWEDAARAVEAAQAEREAMRERHTQEQRALLVSEYGAERVRRDHLRMRTTNPRRDARDARARAAMLRAEADELRSLPVNEAARRIEDKQTERENQQRRAAERARQLRDPFEHGPTAAGPTVTAPSAACEGRASPGRTSLHHAVTLER